MRKQHLTRAATASLAVLCLASSMSHAMAQAPTPQRALLALSKGDHTLAMVDPQTLKVVAKMPVGPDPHEVIASADGKVAYVSNTGSGAFHEINVIDLVNQKALDAIDTGALIGPHGLDYVGNKLWFTAQGAKAVGRFDPATQKFDWALGTGQDATHMLFVTPDQKHVYTTNVLSGTVSVLENVLVPPPVTPTGKTMPGAQPRMDWLETTITAAKGCEGFDISPDGKELWTAAASNGNIYVIDLTTKAVVATIDAKVVGANRLKMTADGKRAFVSSLKTGDVTVLDIAVRKVIKAVNIGHGGAGVLVDEPGKRVFIACTPDDYVAIFDLETLELKGKLDVGLKPDGLAWATLK
jgi:DNA-binding beta-propeller fold protein YncE